MVDQWVKVSDKDTMLMARRMVKEEGLLCGINEIRFKNEL